MSACVVVGTTCGSIPEMLGDDGIIVSECDENDLVRGISDALSLLVKDEIGVRARRRAIAAYSSEAAARQLLRLWREALMRRQRRLH